MEMAKLFFMISPRMSFHFKLALVQCVPRIRIWYILSKFSQVSIIRVSPVPFALALVILLSQCPDSVDSLIDSGLTDKPTKKQTD